MFFRKLRTKDVLATEGPRSKSGYTQKDINNELHERIESNMAYLQEEIARVNHVEGLLKSYQSKLDKHLNEKPVTPKQDELTKKLLEVLMKKSNVRVYEIKQKGKSFYDDFIFSSVFGTFCTNTGIESVSIEGLQEIGEYETFTVGETKYAIVKDAKKEVKEKKVKKAKTKSKK